MLRIRRIEERIADLYPQQQMRCPVHLCIGQEAVAVGICDAVGPKDYAFSGHRSHGHYLAKGGDLKTMMAELYGKSTGCTGGFGGSMHLIDLARGFMGATPIVASSIPIAVGAAWGSVMRQDPRVTLIFFGEGAVEEGAFHESANFAVLKKVPAIFVCENNQFSVYSPMSVRQPEGREVVRVAQGLGMEAHQADGNDVLAVRELAVKAAGKARRGGGPTFLEFSTYRWREHCGPNYDNDLGYRSPAEFEEWRKRCPIEALKERFSPSDLQEMECRITSEIDEAVRFARESPFPQAAAPELHVFSP